MAGTDSAIGAILNIPQEALEKINKADGAIRQLAKTSEDAAKRVSTHWGETAISGLDTFINKLTAAKEQMSKMGDVKVGINTAQVKTQMDETVNIVRKASTDINSELQKAATVGWDKISKVSLKDFDITNYGKNLTEVISNLNNLKSALQNATFSGQNQGLADEIRQIEEFIRLYKQAQQEKYKALSQVQAKDDKVILDEQKRRLAEILDLRKQINAKAITVTSGRITGSDTHRQDVEDLRSLVTRLNEAKKAYADFYTAKSVDLSDKGKETARINALNQENALIKEQMTQRERLNATIARGNELTAATQANKARLGTSNESIAQRQLNTDYKEMLKIIREQGELKAKVAADGRNFNQQEISLIATLAQRYKTYYDDVKRIAGAYSNMATAAAQAFQNDKSAELQRNAVLLATAKEKAAAAAQKEADTTAQQNRKTAESELNRLYAERLRLLKEKEQLEQKDLVNTAKGQVVTLTARENQLLSEITNKLQQNDAAIQRIGNTYAGLAAKTKHAFALDELRQATQLQNQFNHAIDAVNANKAKELTAEYKRLDAQYEKLTRSHDAFIQANAHGAATPSQLDALQRVSDQRNAISMRMAEIERQNIQAVNDFRAQKETEANQQSITNFVQAEAQKTAAARQAAAEQSKARLEANQKYLNTYNGAMRAYDKLGTRSSGNYADTYDNRARVIKQLENALKSLSTTDADYTNKVNRLRSALNALGVKQKEINAIIKQQPQATIASAKQLMDIANTTRSLNDLRAAYNAVRAAQANTAIGSTAFKQLQKDADLLKDKIKNAERAMGEFRNQSAQASNALSGLQSRIAAAFSVAGIMNFAKKVVEVRAQFELQRVALGAIIQDTDKANQIFSRVQQMALESPFTIMGLEKATKQIAAFGFEADKLVPTMKMFADVAAGLGAPIDRLVLVMGHLKARNFLEGTMVRQFTNMGFNVLGELADYYTEIENKMISVGEVQDRVKKKMVSFEDVEEVLKRVTSAGGMFYDMQRKQSDSIWGQMQRIEDATDLMLNDIGRSNDSAIKTFLSAVRSLIIHWRDLKPYIVAAISAMGTYMVVATGYKVIATTLRGITMLYALLTKRTKQATAAQRGLNITMMSNPYAAVAGAIIGIITLIWQWIDADDELSEGIERVNREGLKSMGDLIVQYRQLADTINDVTTPFEKYKQAMEDMQRVYKDILPDKLLELDYIRQTTDGYKEAVDAIRAYSAAKIKENARNEIENLMGDDISEAITDTADEVANLLTLDFGNIEPLVTEVNTDVVRGAVRNILSGMIEEYKQGIAEWDDVGNELQNRLEKYLNVDLYALNENKGLWISAVADITDVYDEMVEKFGSITNIGIDGDIYSVEAQPVIESFNEMDKALTAYKNSLRNLYEIQKKINKDGETDINKSYKERVLKDLQEAHDRVAAYGISPFPDDDEQAIESTVQLTEYIDILDQRLLVAQKDVTGLIQRFSDMARLSDDSKYSWVDFVLLEDNPAVQNFFEKVDDMISGRKLKESGKQIHNIMNEVANSFSIPLSIFDRIKVDGSSTFSTVSKEVENLIKTNQASITSIKNSQAGLLALGYTADFALKTAEKEHGAGKSLAELESETKALIALFEALGGLQKDSHDKGRQEDTELKKWQNIKKAIEDTSKAYEKYRKSFTEDEANKRIEELYGTTFRELGVDIRQFYQYGKYGADSLKQALETLLKTTNAANKERKNFRSELQRDISDTQIEIEIKLKEGEEEKLKSDIEKMFDNYELTKELKSLGLNLDLTYMVGGKPMTLEDIRSELTRLRKEVTNDGTTKASENKIKELESAEKKLTDIQNKEQLQRIKNYKKYLTVMYSDNAQKMIESYTTMSQLEKDFQNYILTLRKEYNNSETTAERKKQLSELIDMLEQQARAAGIGIQNELNQTMAKANWERFKGSDIFNTMYQDVSSLTKEGIDKLITKLETMRKTLQSIEGVDPKAVREVTQYIEKLRNAKVELVPRETFKDGIKALKTINKEYGSLGKAQEKMIEYNDQINSYDQQISDLETLIELQNRGQKIKDDGTETSKRLLALQKLYNGEYQVALSDARNNLSTTKENADKLKEQLDAVAKIEASYNAQIKLAKAWQEQIQSMTNSVFTLMDAFGLDIDDNWKALADAIVNAIVQTVTLQLQFKMLQAEAKILGVAMNASLGVIGWISMGLSTMASLLSAVFGIKDNSLQKQIDKLQDEVDSLSGAFERLETSMERAFNNRNYQSYFESAQQNLAAQKRNYLEMIRLEEAKKKTDDDKIKEYKDKLNELEEAERDMYEKRHERYGSTNDPWSEANNWVDAWLDAYKESGDGLSALNESWDEFYENLVKKQAASRILGQRMDKYISEINAAIDKNLGDEYSYVDIYKSIGERMKEEFASVNEDLLKLFQYAGIGSSGELLLSDLQQGIQNITEPQAAAIEAYLNSMRFAVHRHTEQLDTLIASVQAQYGTGENNPVVTELRGIRGVLDNIYGTLKSVVSNTKFGGSSLRITG